MFFMVKVSELESEIHAEFLRPSDEITVSTNHFPCTKRASRHKFPGSLSEVQFQIFCYFNGIF